MSALENPEYRRGQIRPSLRCPRESTAGDRAHGADRATANLGAEDGAGRRIDAEEIRTNLPHGRAVQLGNTDLEQNLLRSRHADQVDDLGCGDRALDAGRTGLIGGWRLCARRQLLLRFRTVAVFLLGWIGSRRHHGGTDPATGRSADPAQLAALYGDEIRPNRIQ